MKQTIKIRWLCWKEILIIQNLKYNINYSSPASKRYVLCPVVTISPSSSLKTKSSLRLQGMLYRDSRSRQTLPWRFLLRRNKTKILRFLNLCASEFRLEKYNLQSRGINQLCSELEFLLFRVFWFYLSPDLLISQSICPSIVKTSICHKAHRSRSRAFSIEDEIQIFFKKLKMTDMVQLSILTSGMEKILNVKVTGTASYLINELLWVDYG